MHFWIKSHKMFRLSTITLPPFCPLASTLKAELEIVFPQQPIVASGWLNLKFTPLTHPDFLATLISRVHFTAHGSLFVSGSTSNPGAGSSNGLYRKQHWSRAL